MPPWLSRSSTNGNHCKAGRKELGVPVEIGGEEAESAILGALTTPGTAKPMAILDLGAGSTDASIINQEGKIKAIHLAGAGNMVTMLINSELGLEGYAYC